MGEQYFIIRNGESVGPLSLDELIVSSDLNPNSMIWKPGMENWATASTFPELRNVLRRDETMGPRYGSGYQRGPTPPPHDRYFAGNPQYRQEHRYSSYERPYRPSNENYGFRRESSKDHTNWLPWAIVGTVLGLCSCIGLIFGIIGIVQANNANTLYSQGFVAEGAAKNSTAKIMTIISLVWGGLNVLGLIIWFIFGAAAFGTSLSYI